MLVMAANPCPCGQPGTSRHPCRCAPSARRRYLARLSGPLLDRIDVKVTVVRATRAELLADRRLAEPGPTVGERVALARERAAKRLAGTPWRHNGEIASAALHRDFRLPDRTLAPLHRGLDLGLMSARALDRILRVAWTVGDLAGKDQPEDTDIAVALAMWMGEH
jgi:magnesium chelatase family protein